MIFLFVFFVTPTYTPISFSFLIQERSYLFAFKAEPWRAFSGSRLVKQWNNFFFFSVQINGKMKFCGGISQPAIRNQAL